MDKYELGTKLGSGGFATVWLARRKSDGKTLAVKKIEVSGHGVRLDGAALPRPARPSLARAVRAHASALNALPSRPGVTCPRPHLQCENFDDANQALTEGKMLLELDHHHVIKYYDFFLHQEKGGGAPRGGKMFVVLVMSYAPDGDLFSKLERAHKAQQHIPEETIRKWLYQMSQALVYIASKNIIHRDIKLANVLVEGDVLKVADFGIAKVMHGKFAQTIVGGTPCYMAPELLYKERYNTKSDIWSLGCLIWELSCRSLLSQNKGVLGAQVSLPLLASSVPRAKKRKCSP